MGKLKRNICRFLIALQIYGNVFQGVAHAADLADNNGISNHIHLVSIKDKDGTARLALGTDDEDGKFKPLKSIDIPSSDNLNLPIKKSFTGLSDEISETTSVNGGNNYDDDDNASQYSGSGLSTNDTVVGKGDFKPQKMVYNLQATYFTLQGLKFAINNTGAISIKGQETDQPKPLFLSGFGPITLDSVDASVLQITSPQVLMRGYSKIDYLKIEGLSSESSFINLANLTTKQLFLSNLKGDNAGYITSDSLTLEKTTYLKLSNASRADLQTLVLGPKSHLENHGNLEVVGTQSLKDLGLEFLYDYQSLSKPYNMDDMAWLKILEAERNKAEFLGADEAFKSFSLEISATIADKYGLSAKTRSKTEQAELVRLIIDTRLAFSDTPNLFNDFYKKQKAQLSEQHQTHIKIVQQFDTITDLAIKDKNFAKQWSQVDADKLLDKEFVAAVNKHAGLTLLDEGCFAPSLITLAHTTFFFNSRDKPFKRLGSITNEDTGVISFKPDIKTQRRYLKGVLADKEPYTHLLLEKLINLGTINSIQNFRIHSDIFDNAQGLLHSPSKVDVHTNQLTNKKASISGVQGTTIFVRGDQFNNHEGEIGVEGELGVVGKTSLIFKKAQTGPILGKIQGDEIEIEDLSRLGETHLRNGKLIVKNFVYLKGHKIFLPYVEIDTPKLRLSLVDFSIDSTYSKTSPRRTIIERSVNQDLRLTHPYYTAGELEIRQGNIFSQHSALVRMQERFGDAYQTHIEPTHTIDIQATVKAKRGMVVYTPAAIFRYGDNAVTAIHELLLEEYGLKVYASAFDFEKGTLAAKSLRVHAPLGIHFGRLIQDPNSDIFATFGSHSQCPTSHGLGGHIRVCKYEVMGKEVNGVYDGRCLLKLPKIVPNETVVQVQKASELHGPLLNHGRFSTHDLMLKSAKDSLCEASTINVAGNFDQQGNLLLKRNTSQMYLTYHQHHLHWEFVNSDSASLMVYGELTQTPEIAITNVAGHFHTHKTQNNLRVESKHFNSAIFQKEYTKAEQLDFVKQEQLALEKYKPNNQITRPCNDFAHAGCYPDLVSFLHKTKNFYGAQQVFVSDTSSSNGAMLTNYNNQPQVYGGNISFPQLVVKAGVNGVTFCTRNRFWTEPKDPIHDLLKKGFSIQNTFVTPDLRKLIDQELATKYFFTLRERFFYDLDATQAFYEYLRDDIVVCDVKGARKSTGKAVFQISPKMLLEEVRKECQETLHRGNFFDNQVIDYDMLKQLHKNASTYLEEHQLLSKELSQALMVKGSSKVDWINYQSIKPMIFYDAVMNLEGIEELVAKLYIPEAMMDDARGKLGSKLRTNFLLVFPEGITVQQLLELVRDTPNAPLLRDFLKKNPRALEEKEEGLAEGLEEIDLAKIDLKNSITMFSEMEIGQMAIFNTGNINIHASITTKKAIINSLFGSVVLQSLVERKYFSPSNYQDVIPLKARIAALEDTLVILAKENIVILGAETFSEKGTYLEALGCIYDLPVELVTQRYQSHSEGWSRDKWTNNVRSSHKSNSNFNSYAGDKQTICANYDVGENDINIFAKKGIDSIDVKNTHESASHTKTQSNSLLGGTTTKDKMSGSAVSVGSSYKCGLLNFYTEQGDVNLTNVTIDADRVDISAIEGFVRFLLGTNSFYAGEQTSSSNIAWQSQSMKQTEDRTYSQSQIKVGKEGINIKSKDTVVQQVAQSTSLPFFKEELEVPDFAKLINQDGGKITFQTLHEIHKCKEESHQGPTQMFAALVGIAIAIATAGTGSGLGAFIAESAGQVAVVATATTAATLTSAGLLTQAITTTLFTTLCSQATLAVLNSDGKAENVIKQMTSKDNLNQLLLAVVKTPGGQPTGNFFQQVLEKGIRNTGWAMFEKIIMNKPLDQGIRDAWINAGIDTVAQVCAKNIGELYKPDVIKTNGFNTTTESVNKINWGTHKWLHGALGFLCGGMRSKLSGGSFEQGAVAGALGAVVATTVVEMLKPDVTEEMMRCQSEGLNKEEFKEQFMEKAQRSVKWGDFIAATTSFLAGQDVTTSYGTAKNATENNCHPGFVALAFVAADAYEVWQSVAAIAAAGGLLALLNSIQVKEHQDGSYGFEGKKYGTLQEVLRTVMETSLLYSIVAVSTIANIMGIDLDANKPTSQITPIDQGKTPNMITYKDEGKSEDKGFSQLPEELLNGPKEGYKAYEGPNANVLEQKSLGNESSIKGNLKAVELPTKGKIRFIPDKSYNPSRPLERGDQKGYLDKFGNEWVKGPSRTQGQTFEWDVQLSRKGKSNLDWLSRDGEHINVSLDGKITHK